MGTIFETFTTFSCSLDAMFAERKVCYSALFTYLVGWHASAVSFPLSDVIFALLACPMSNVIFCLPSGITNLSVYKHCLDIHKHKNSRLIVRSSLPALLDKCNTVLILGKSCPILLETYFYLL